MTSGTARFLLLLGLALGFCGSGCVYRNGVSTCRMWADYNTLMAPALYFDETDHLPYHAPRVEHYRWMYNADALAQSRSGAVHPVGGVSPSQPPMPAGERPVPAPAELAPEYEQQPEMNFPPLPLAPLPQAGAYENQPTPVPPAPKPSSPTRGNDSGPTAAESTRTGRG